MDFQMRMTRLDLDEVRCYIEKQSLESKIYIGCDSERVCIDKEWFADYALVIVIHKNGNNGGKIFGEVIRERDYDKKHNKPKFRLMNEIYKLSELYLKLSDVLVDRDVQVHIDINPDENCVSNCVINEAIGYIKGTCNVIPIVKPNAWAASCCADRFKEINSRKIA